MKKLAVPENPERRKNLAELCRIADAADCHFRSCWQQIVFILLRDRGGDVEKMKQILRSEKRTAAQLLRLVNVDSRIGYEPSNHYFYIGRDLVEKIANCDELLAKLNEKAST